MATVDYAGVAVEVAAAIAEVGQVGAIKRTTPPDPILGGDGTTTSYPATLVSMAYNAHYVNGTTILAKDRQIYVSAVGLAIVPSVGDLVTVGGTDYRIVNDDSNNFDGVTNVVFVVQGRVDA